MYVQTNSVSLVVNTKMDFDNTVLGHRTRGLWLSVVSNLSSMVVHSSRKPAIKLVGFYFLNIPCSLVEYSSSIHLFVVIAISSIFSENLLQFHYHHS